jgi:hypothetical protein
MSEPSPVSGACLDSRFCQGTRKCRIRVTLSMFDCPRSCTAARMQQKGQKLPHWQGFSAHVAQQLLTAAQVPNYYSASAFLDVGPANAPNKRTQVPAQVPEGVKVGVCQLCCLVLRSVLPSATGCRSDLRWRLSARICAASCSESTSSVPGTLPTSSGICIGAPASTTAVDTTCLNTSACGLVVARLLDPTVPTALYRSTATVPQKHSAPASPMEWKNCISFADGSVGPPAASPRRCCWWQRFLTSASSTDLACEQPLHVCS